MKSFRHTLYIASLALMCWLLPYSFHTEERAGYAYAVVLFLVVVLYATEQGEDVFKRIKKDEGARVAEHLGVDEDEDARYR